MIRRAVRRIYCAVAGHRLWPKHPARRYRYGHLAWIEVCSRCGEDVMTKESANGARH